MKQKSKTLKRVKQSGPFDPFSVCKYDGLVRDVMKQAPPPRVVNSRPAQRMRLKGGAMERIYIGVDFHARQQTICYLTTEGEILFHELKHQDKEAVRQFYARFSGQVMVGLEASGYSLWFERLLAELGCEVWLGNATQIRRRARSRHKN